MKNEDSHPDLFCFPIHTDHGNERLHIVSFSNSDKSILVLEINFLAHQLV